MVAPLVENYVTLNGRDLSHHVAIRCCPPSIPHISTTSFSNFSFLLWLFLTTHRGKEPPWECKMRAEVAIGEGGVVWREEMKLLTASPYRCHDNHTGGDLGWHLPLFLHSISSRPSAISLLVISSQWGQECTVPVKRNGPPPSSHSLAQGFSTFSLPAPKFTLYLIRGPQDYTWVYWNAMTIIKNYLKLDTLLQICSHITQ
jgi:hypothetical protein